MTTITATPIVFVVDDDLTVRESLESLIGTSGWRAETFASAREFLARPQASVPSCLVLDVALPDFSGLDLRSASPSIARRCQSFSSPGAATFR